MDYTISKVSNKEFLNATADERKRIVELGCFMYKNLTVCADTTDVRIGHLEELNRERLNQINTQNQVNQLLLEENTTLKNKYLCSNTKKGQDGEKSVDDFIAREFCDIEMMNTAKQTAQGDLQIKYKGSKGLIEVKNKQTITKEDNTKFERDVSETDNEFGVFVVTPNKPIPYKGYLYFNILDNKPVVYMSDFENNPNVLKLCIEVCVSVSKKIKGSITDQSMKYESLSLFINNMIPMIKEIISNQQKSLTQLKKMDKLVKDQIDTLLD